jgi:hypothetical protein
MNASVTWNANVDATVGYLLYHGVNVGVFDDVKNIPGIASTSYTYTGLEDGILHYFAIEAYDGVPNLSGQSGAVSKSGPAPSLRRIMTLKGMSR